MTALTWPSQPELFDNKVSSQFISHFTLLMISKIFTPFVYFAHVTQTKINSTHLGVALKIFIDKGFTNKTTSKRTVFFEGLMHLMESFLLKENWTESTETY